MTHYLSLLLFFIADLQEIRKLLEAETDGAACPSCKMPFDKGKKRKLIDNCGHGRCYSCMFKNEECPVCQEQIYDNKKGKQMVICFCLFVFLFVSSLYSIL